MTFDVMNASHYLDKPAAQLRAEEQERRIAYVESLEVERQALVERGKVDRVKMVDAELARARKAI